MSISLDCFCLERIFIIFDCYKKFLRGEAGSGPHNISCFNTKMYKYFTFLAPPAERPRSFSNADSSVVRRRRRRRPSSSSSTFHLKY